MKNFKKYLITFIIFFPFVPALVLAAGAPQNFQDLIGRAIELISLSIPLLMSAAVLFFVYGIAKYIYLGDNESERAKGKQFIVWGIIALFVMISIWGLVGVLSQTIFGASSSGNSGSSNSGSTDYWKSFMDSH